MILHSPDIPNQLAFARGSATLVRLYRDDIEDAPLHGYIAAHSEHLAALAVVGDGITFDGFDIVRTADITELEIPHPHTSFIETALELRNLSRPVLPAGADLGSQAALLRSLAPHHPLLTLHLELADPDNCYIGKFVGADERFVTLGEIGPDADYAHAPTRVRLADITRISCGGAYEDALNTVATSRGHAPPDFSGA